MSIDDLAIPTFLAIDVEPFDDAQLDELLDWRELGDAAEDIPDDHRAAPAARWEITDLNGAEWVARKWGEVTAESDEIREKARYWRDRITAWERRQLATRARRAAHYEALAEQYLAPLREASRHVKRSGEVDYRTKSLNLPSGTFTSRKVAERAVAETPDDVVAFLLHVDPNHPALKHELLISKLPVEIVDEKPTDPPLPGDDRVLTAENDEGHPHRIPKLACDYPVHVADLDRPGEFRVERQPMRVQVPGLRIEPEHVDYGISR